MNRRRNKTLAVILAILCYGLAALLWLGAAVAHAVGDARRNPWQLDTTTAETEFLAPGADGVFISESNDPKLIFTGIDENVRLVRLAATFAAPPGEMELFYTRSDDEGFSAGRRVIGVPQADGSYVYALPAGRVHSLRIDPGTAGGNAISIHTIEVNPRMPPASYFVPSLRDVLGLLFWAGLALCGARLLLSALRLLRRRGPARQAAGGT